MKKAEKMEKDLERGEDKCCGSGEVEVENMDEEKAAYKRLITDLLWAEESKVTGWKVLGIGIEAVVVSGLASAMACTLTLEPMKHERWLGLRMWQYVMMAAAVFAGLTIIRWITKAVFGVVLQILQSKWMLHRNVGYFLREMKTCVDVALWFCTVMFLWYVWFRPRLKHVMGDVSVVLSRQMTRLLLAACLGALLWVAKNALFFWLEADLHYRQLCDRIVHTICQLHVLHTLHKKPDASSPWRFLHQPQTKQGCVSKPREEGRNICRDLLQVKRETVPVLILRRLCEEYTAQFVTRPLPVDKRSIQNPELLVKEAFHLFSQMSPPIPRINNSVKTESDDEDDEVTLGDLQTQYGVELDDLRLFRKRINPGYNVDENYTDEQAKDLEIGRDEFCSWAVVAYRNYWGLRNTLHSSEQIILKLNRMMIVFILILTLIIWLLLSEIVDSAQIALLFSPLLAAKFIFSESTKNMFDGLIFALAMHPFSPGDRVVVNEMELLVMEINILSTTFYKYQSGEELVYPNSELATTQIINLEYVPDQSDHLEFSIEKDTPLEDIRDLEIKIQVSLDYRRDAFRTKVVKTEMGLDNIKMTVRFDYVGCYLTCEMKAVHKSEILSTIMQLQKKKPPIPTDNDPNSMPLTCKPYIVRVILPKKVKLEDLQTIQVAIQGSLSSDNINVGCNSKVVGYNVSGKHVRMAFYIWNRSSKQHEIISDSQLLNIQGRILEKLNIPRRNEDQVEIQTNPGVADVVKYQPENDNPNDSVMEYAIKRYLSKKCYQYEFEVKILEDRLHVYAWRQFPHGIEEENQPLDVQKILEQNLVQINQLHELRDRAQLQIQTNMNSRPN